MEVITQPPGAGKTTKLIEIADDYNGYIVCFSQSEVDRVYKHAREMGREINQPITFKEFVDGKYGRFCKKFYIDNLDMCIEGISRLPIEVVTFREDEQKDL